MILSGDEYIQTIVSSHGKSPNNDDAVDRVEFVTNKRTIGPCGYASAGSVQRTFTGSRLLYIAGYAGGFIDTLVYHIEH